MCHLHHGFQRRLASTSDRIVWRNGEVRRFFDYEALPAYSDLEATQLIGDGAFWVLKHQMGCERLGPAAEAHAPHLPAVESDVPTLVVKGALDTQTPAEWGDRATDNLSDVTVVTIPMAGHAAGLVTERGGALVRALLLAPGDTLNCASLGPARRILAMPEDQLRG